MSDKIIFYYFGDDEAYFRALRGEFAKHTSLPIDFRQLYQSDEKNIQSFFLLVAEETPSCIFIDFSKQSQDYLHLARIIARTPLTKKPISVGLVDYLSPPDILTESIATGVNFSFIKSAEIFDVVFSVAALAFPNELSDHGFAMATLSETWQVGVPVKVGFVQEKGVHFETDLLLKKGDRIKLKHFWLQKKVVPSREVFINNFSQTNLFYHFNYAVDAEFFFVDEFSPPEEMDVKEVGEKQKEREELITYHKHQLKKWIKNNKELSLEKKAKVLIIDKEFQIYRNQPRSDKYSFTIRCVPTLNNIEDTLSRLGPQIIAFSMESTDSPEPINTEESLKKMVELLLNQQGQQIPFLIIFNTNKTSKELQEFLGYKQLMATGNEISVEILLRMASVFDKKISTLFANKTDTENKVFLSKTHSATIGEINYDINIIKLSETDMVFQCDRELPLGLNLHVESPLNMYVKVMPSSSDAKEPEYRGLIHALGEEQKKELRRLVNSIFFRDHDAQVQAELEEFMKLNETKEQERIKALEEEQKAKEQQEKEEGAVEKDPETSC